MCKKCKHCGESNLGVLLTQISTIAAKRVNGEIVEFFKESEENVQKEEVNFCFTCNKQITEADLVETVKCKTCGKEVANVDAEGLCDECSKVKHEAEEEANKLRNMSQEELVAMLMAQKLGKATTNIIDDIQDIPSESIPTEKDNTAVAATDLEVIEDDIETKDLKEKAPAKKRSAKKKVEPAPVEEEGVNDAREEIAEKVEDAPAPESAHIVTDVNEDGTSPSNVDATIPAPSDSDDEEDILAALNKVQLGDNGIPDIF